MKNSLIKVLVLSGPTGIGKTLIASLLAKQLDGEIISCDSVQVYKELSIGSNKEKLEDVKQHLIDVVSWKEPFSAGSFLDLTVALIEDIHKRGKVPLVVGGTGFYINWLLRGKPTGPPSSPEVMNQIEKDLRGKSWEESFDILENVDPVYASTLVRNDFYRLHRALAIYRMTGKPLSEFLPKKEQELLSDELSRFDFRCFYLTHDRAYISKLIDRRCEDMLVRGLLQEVIQLKEQGMDSNCNAGRSIGYYQTLTFLDQMKNLWAKLLSTSNSDLNSDSSKKEQKEESDSDYNKKRKEEFFNLSDDYIKDFIADFKTASRQYSRRQDTWFREDEAFKWCHWGLFDLDKDKLTNYIKESFLKKKEEWTDPNSVIDHIDVESRKMRFDEQVQKSMRLYKSALEVYGHVEKRRELFNVIYDFLNK